MSPISLAVLCMYAQLYLAAVGFRPRGTVAPLRFRLAYKASFLTLLARGSGYGSSLMWHRLLSCPMTHSRVKQQAENNIGIILENHHLY